ncbi:MAG: hypothetical protein ACTSUE_13465 [Promethearchaeota archaeon]
MKTRVDDLPMANKSMTVDSTVPGNQSPAFSWKSYNRRKAVNEMRRHQRRIFKATNMNNLWSHGA